MKKVISSLFTLAAVVFTMNIASAQCAKSTASAACCKSKAEGTASVSTDVNKPEAMLVAMKDQNVQEKVCETSGKVSYHMLNNDDATASQEVSFDDKLGRFVNVSPSKACCAKDSKEAKACAAKEGATGKACCASKGKADVKS
jgi:hypothetical protein